MGQNGLLPKSMVMLMLAKSLMNLILGINLRRGKVQLSCTNSRRRDEDAECRMNPTKNQIKSVHIVYVNYIHKFSDSSKLRQ